MRPTWRCSQIK